MAFSFIAFGRVGIAYAEREMKFRGIVALISFDQAGVMERTVVFGITKECVEVVDYSDPMKCRSVEERGCPQNDGGNRAAAKKL